MLLKQTKNQKQPNQNQFSIKYKICAKKRKNINFIVSLLKLDDINNKQKHQHSIDQKNSSSADSNIKDDDIFK